VYAVRQISTALLILTGLSTLAACSPHERESARVNVTSHEDYNVSVKTGGQPGALEIRGSLITNKGEPTGQLNVRRATGHDFKGFPGKLRAGKNLSVSTRLTPQDFKEIEAARGRADFAQFGCPDNFSEETAGRKILRPAEGGALTVRADLIILCGDFTFAAEDVKLVAMRVIMVDARVKVNGTAGSSLSIFADNLYLRGVNSIATKGTDNMAQFGAPALTVVGNHLLGLGRLNVDVEGNDWVKTK
jgi:hypothetical protein